MKVGGIEMTKEQVKGGQLKADMCEVAMQISFQHGARIVEALLDQFEIRRKS